MVIAGRSQETLDQVVETIRGNGGSCLDVPTDIREIDQVEALRDAAYATHGRVDLLINNAGGQFPSLPSGVSDNGWRAVEHDLETVGHTEETFSEELIAVGSSVRMGRVDEMAAMIHFLCSPAARYVSGSTIVADGASMQSNWVNFFAEGEL